MAENTPQTTSAAAPAQKSPYRKWLTLALLAALAVALYLVVARHRVALVASVCFSSTSFDRQYTVVVEPSPMAALVGSGNGCTTGYAKLQLRRATGELMETSELVDLEGLKILWDNHLDVVQIPGFSPKFTQFGWLLDIPPKRIVTQAYLNGRLGIAAQAGNLEQARELIAKGANVNAGDASGQTPLHHAARLKHLPVMQTLVDHHANLDLQDADGDSALHVAHKFSFTDQEVSEELRFLVEHGANPNVCNRFGETPLFASHMSAREVQLLVDHGADAKVHNEFGESVLVKRADTAEGYAVLLAHGATMEYGGKYLDKVLEPVLGTCNDVAMRDLLAHGVPLARILHEHGIDEMLGRAISYRKLGMVRLLLEHKPDLTRKNENGKTPLQLARDLLSSDLLARTACANLDALKADPHCQGFKDLKVIEELLVAAGGT